MSGLPMTGVEHLLVLQILAYKRIQNLLFRVVREGLLCSRLRIPSSKDEGGGSRKLRPSCPSLVPLLLPRLLF